MMFKLYKNHYTLAYEAYKKENYFFPLVASVLLDEQDGNVYADSRESPTQFFVEHAFGFSQIFGEKNLLFLNSLEKNLITEKIFRANKVRLYSPSTPDFLQKPYENVLLSYRRRFHLDKDVYLNQKKTAVSGDVQTVKVDSNNVQIVEDKFKVVGRFWRTQDDFIAKGLACLVLYNNNPASICYSAAIADNCAEIDVFTLDAYRKFGLAGIAVTEFIENCFKAGIQPLWDCFTNNRASMALAKSIGFVPYTPPYNFYTINK